ncbi:MAG: type 4a pilus biogenesis protein PilO [Deltaproteobacteria bacterium]
MAITVNDIKKLSPQAKAVIVIGIILLISYLYYFYFLSDSLTKRAKLDKDYQDVQLQIKQKEKIVSQLDKYKADVAALEGNYKMALLKLPDQREIPGLFHSVALAGRDAGIEFILFEPKAAVPKTLDKAATSVPKTAAMLKPSDQRQTDKPPADTKKPAPKSGGKETKPEPFYEEIPVKVTVMGNFQNTVHFFEKVAKLPRIVNVSDIAMGDRKIIQGRGYLITTSCTVKTYMFVDKQEKTSEKKNEKN